MVKFWIIMHIRGFNDIAVLFSEKCKKNSIHDYSLDLVNTAPKKDIH